MTKGDNNWTKEDNEMNFEKTLEADGVVALKTLNDLFTGAVT